MFINRNIIEFKVCYSNEEYHLKTHWGEYRTLRLLLKNKMNIPNFGQCEGLGRCASCLVEFVDLEKETSFLRRSEHTNTQKMIKNYSIVRFACQIPVTNDLANVTVKILGNQTVAKPANCKTNQPNNP